MEFGSRTLSVLKNFSTINPSIQFKEGNTLKTISPNKTIMASANLEDNIESTFAIYNLSRFLGVISLFEKPVFELKEKLINIVSPGRKVSYMFANPETLVLPPSKELNLGDIAVEFDLTQESFSEIVKALGVMSFPDLIITNENGKIILRATDSKNPSADSFDIDVGTTDKKFTAVFKSENLKIMNDNYHVKISTRGMANFKSKDLEYWISIESHSTFE